MNESPTRAPRLVIFDCDGVLVDSEAISDAVMATSITAVGIPITPEQVSERYRGLLLADIGADVERRIGAELPDDFWQRFDKNRADAFEARLKPIDGARETISSIQAAGIRTCVASQGRLEKTELTLRLTGLRDLFRDDELFSAYTVRRGKPFPDLFLHAAQTLGVRPRECLVIEDSPTGIQAAVAAAMRVIAYVESGQPPKAAPAVSTIRQLPDLISMILRRPNVEPSPT